MKNNKSPGPDGFSSEFFKFFWKDLGIFLVRSWNLAFTTNELSLTQRQGVITILPKADKPREYLKDWRPISLLNVSYKILSGVLSGRMKSVLPKLINEDQKGFISGRFISDNTRVIYDILQRTKEKNIPGMLLLVDFEKAFDSISWNFMYKCLHFFGFGQQFIKWIKLLNNNVKLCVIQNGIFSDFFNIERGCRQGDPISPYLFNLCVEVLAIMIRHNKEVKGIIIGGKEYCLLQYADDTCVFLDGSEKSLKSALDLLFQFSKYSGLKPNIEKTQAVWIGNKIKSKEKLCANYKLNWNESTFKALGIIFSSDISDIVIANYGPKIDQIKKELLQWSKRNLTTLGKITVVKSLMLPQLSHLFFTLPSPDSHMLKELNNIFFWYIWGNKRDKVSRKQMIKDYRDGGGRMIDIYSYIKALKLTMFRRLLSTKCEWSALFCEICQCNLEKLVKYGDEYPLSCARKSNNIFWKESLKYLNEFIKVTEINNTEPWNNHLLYNSSIRINNESIKFNILSENNITFVYDVLNTDGQFLSFNEFEDRFNINICFVTYMGIINAIKKAFPSIRNVIHDDNNIHILPIIPSYIRYLFRDKKGSRTLYDIFIKNIDHTIKYQNKWEAELSRTHFNWTQINSNIFRTKESKYLQWLQYRIIHRIIGTNKSLYLMKIKQSPLCTFCGEEDETILHLFFDCRFVSDLLSRFINWLNSNTDLNIVITRQNIY